MVKNQPANTGDLRDEGSFPGLGGSLGGGHGNQLQYSCLENPRGRGAWRATVHGVAKSQTRLSDERVTFLFLHLFGHRAWMGGGSNKRMNVKVSQNQTRVLSPTHRGDRKSWLKAQHSENEDHGSRSHHCMANRWGNSANSG